MITNSANPGVTINVLVPSNLHKQLRHKALDEGVMMKDAVVEAIEAWVTPGEREAQVIRQVLVIFDQSNDKAKARAQIQALASPPNPSSV